MSKASPFNPEPRDVERARLAAAAPEMARLLLELAKGVTFACGYENVGGCPCCRDVEPIKHDADCALMMVLRKAGVR